MASELTVEDVVVIAHVHATGVEPQPALERARGGPQQVVVEVHVAGALIEIDQSQGADPHAEDVVTIVQHVIGDLRALAVQCSAAGEIAGEQSGVLGLEHAVVEVVVGKQGGGVVHRSPRARCLARAVPVEVEKVAPGVAHGVEGDLVSADAEILVVGKVAHRIGDRIEVMGGVAHLVDQAIVDRMMIAPQMKPGSGTETDAGVEKHVVVAADKDPRLARLDGVAPRGDLSHAVLKGEVRDVR